MPRGRPRKQAEPTTAGTQPGAARRQAAVNKTEAIRALVEECTQAGRGTAPKGLTEELKRRYPSEEWTIAYVSSIKSKLKKRRPPRAAASLPPDEAGPGPVQDAVGLVLALKRLAKQAGGLDRLKQLIEALQSDG